MSILVIGSTNTDLVIRAERFPLPGQTIIGENFFTLPGGKGANQAVAVARLGGKVSFLTKVGNDLYGRQARQQFQEEGICTDFVLTDPHHPSGVALIVVDAQGENSIVTAPGANSAFTPADLDRVRALPDTALLLVQLELPLDTVAHACRLALASGKRIILNPAPATQVPDALLQGLWVISPNRFEGEALTGIPIKDLRTAAKAGEKIREKGVAHVVLTLGSEGVLLCNEQGVRHFPAQKVQAIDTTGAGDVFSGALAVALAEGKPMEEAVEFANRAAAVSVTRMGAMASIPYRREVV
jgi:ribokinase